MRFCLLAALSCLFALNAFSQQFNNGIALSAGPAFPVGKFASSAKTGGLLDLSYSHRLRRTNFGITALLRARGNSAGANAFLYPLMQENPGYSWPPEYREWKAGTFMVGVYHDSRLTQRFGIEEGFLAGIADIRMPAYTLTAVKSLSDFPGDADLLLVNAPKTSAATFSSQAKIGAYRTLARRISVFADLDYWYTRPVFNHVPAGVTQVNGLVIPYVYSPSNARNPPAVYSYSVNYKQNTSSINLTAGIRVHL